MAGDQLPCTCGDIQLKVYICPPVIGILFHAGRTGRWKEVAMPVYRYNGAPGCRLRLPWG